MTIICDMILIVMFKFRELLLRLVTKAGEPVSSLVWQEQGKKSPPAPFSWSQAVHGKAQLLVVGLFCYWHVNFDSPNKYIYIYIYRQKIY